MARTGKIARLPSNIRHSLNLRPILFGALAWADILLTLDRGDFDGLLDGRFYGLLVIKPGTFIARNRALGNLS